MRNKAKDIVIILKKHPYFNFLFELILTFLPGLFYLYFNKAIRTNFPEETFLLNSWNLFTSLIPNYLNPLGYQRTLTSYASIPEFIFSPFFNPEKPFQILTYILVFRLLLLTILNIILFRILISTLFYRIIVFNFIFFTTTMIWTLLVSPRFYSIILFYILLIVFFRVNLFNYIKILIAALTTSLLTIAILSNVANLLSTFIVFFVTLCLIIVFDNSFINNLKNKFLYIFIFTILFIYFLGIAYVMLTSKFFSELRINHDFGFIPLSGNPLLSLVGSGHWSEFTGSGGIPYCSFCPLQNEYLIFRISITITLILISLFIISKAFNFRAMILTSFLVILFPVVSALGRSNEIFSFLINNYSYLRIFREPWSKFSYFIPLFLGIIFTFAQKGVTLIKEKYFNLILIGAPLVILFVYLYVAKSSYIIPISFTYSIFIWIIIILFFYYFKNVSILLATVPILYLFGFFNSISNITSNEQLTKEIKKEYFQAVEAFKFFEIIYKEADFENEKKCFIINSYNRESMINYLASSISPIPKNLLGYKQLKSPSINISRDSNDCIKNSSEYDQIYFPSTFNKNNFFDSTFFKEFCSPTNNFTNKYFSELDCNRIDLLEYKLNTSKFVSFTDPNNKGLGLVSSDVISINSNHAVIFMNPEILVNNWLANIEFSVKANPKILQLGKLNVDLYIENLRVGTISLSGTYSSVSLEIPFGSFSDGSLQKIDFISVLNPDQQKLLDNFNSEHIKKPWDSTLSLFDLKYTRVTY